MYHSILKKHNLKKLGVQQLRAYLESQKIFGALTDK